MTTRKLRYGGFYRIDKIKDWDALPDEVKHRVWREEIEWARKRFEQSALGSPLYRARLAKNPDYFKTCSPGRWIYPAQDDDPPDDRV